MRGQRGCLHIFAPVAFFTISIAIYLFVAIHFGPNATLAWILLFLPLSAVVPAFDGGYRDDVLIADDVLNRQDCWRIIGDFFYIFTFVIPILYWVHYDGLYPDTVAVHLTFWGNLCFGLAYVAWYRKFVYKTSSGFV